MYQTSKLDNAIREINRCNIAILPIAESRWTGTGHFTAGPSELVIYSGRSTHFAGVAVIVSKQMRPHLMAYKTVSDRIIYVWVKASPLNVSILQVQAPTLSADDEETEEFYLWKQQELDSLPSQDVIFVVGDFNAKLDVNTRSAPVGGKYGLSISNYNAGTTLPDLQN